MAARNMSNDSLAVELIRNLYESLSILNSAMLSQRGDISIPYLAKLPFPHESTGTNRGVVGQLGLDGVSDESLDRYVVQRELYDPVDGLDSVVSIYGMVEYAKNQDRKSTVRMPGVAIVPDGIIDLAIKVNEDKSALSEFILSLKDSSLKRQIKRELNVCLLHCYRHIVTIQQPVTAVTFTWVTSNSSVKKLTIKELRKQITSFHFTDASISNANNSGTVENAKSGMLELLKSLPENEVVALKRTVRPNVRVRVKGENGWLKSPFDGAMPIMIAKSAYNDNVLLSNLKTPVERPKKSRVFEDAPLIERIGCYRYLNPEYKS